LPSKSGVSGGVLAVLPGQFGIGVFSPRLDGNGNSARGIQICERIAADFDLHPMRFQPSVNGVVRRTYTCAEVRSNRLRPGREVELLVGNGGGVRVFELQGELFVGTADRVFRQVVGVLDEIEIAILDCARVTRTDTAARRLIDQMKVALGAVGCELVLAGAGGEVDVDTALERCEDLILARLGGPATDAPAVLESQELLRALDARELAALAAATRALRLAAGDVLFKHGDPADSVFFIASGALTVQLPGADADADGYGTTPRCLARLGPGVCVGEMALLGDTVRSADVVVTQDCVLTEIPTAAVTALHDAYPDLAAHLYAGLAAVLADRLRRANEQLLLVG
jgi:glutaminase